ncbi:neurexin 1 isoform X2 [Lepeophtheirus salmonis]|uniref:neurexin 1 isoform X2 n=1 Tax=Lepeophtheirus salmonis TaxID=72036 RepID=UPI003AF3AEC0
MILLVLLVSFLPVEGIVLEGSQTSYAQFPQWLGDVNSTLELKFRTNQKNALLLYTDNIEHRDFAQITLVSGSKVRLRYNWNGAQNGNRFNIITVNLGASSPPGSVHRVRVLKNGAETSLIVDDRKESLLTPLVLTSTQSSASLPPSTIPVPYQFGDPVSNSFLYIGGLPTWYREKFDILTLPTVILEPRFRGEISDIKFKDARTKVFKIQEVLAYKGVRASTVNACDHQDPCLNDGICLPTDSGPICDCSKVDFIGLTCETKKQPLEATFRHGDYITYDLQQRNVEPILSTNDDISLFFKTRKSSGLLFYTGNGNDYMNLGIKDGGVSLTVQLGTGKLDTQIKPSTVRFNDNKWHHVKVSRMSSEVTLTVDDLYNERWVTSGSFSVLASTKVFVGGSEATYTLPGTKAQNNLVGCLRSVIYTADSLILDLLGLAENNNQLISVIGDVEYECQDIAAVPPLPFKSQEDSSSNMASIYMMQNNLGGIISFTTQESFLVLPSWKSTISGSISLKFRTNELNGILLFNGGNPHKDYFAFEILDGHLYVHLDLGSGPVKIRASRTPLNDGAWHHVELTLSQRSGRIKIDEDSESFKTPGEANQLDLVGNLFVGGVDYMDPYMKFPPTLWTVTLKYGFVGCLRDLTINGASIDVVSYAHQQDVGSIRSSCHKMPDQCHDRPCNHGGKCSEGWNRFLCDCSRTSFTGATCGYAAATVIFEGSHSISLSYKDGTTTEADDIILRFRSMEQHGILFTTHHDTSKDKLDVTMESGRVRLSFQVGHSEKTIFAGQSLNDDIYHTILLQRRGTKIRVVVDDDEPIDAELLNSESILRYSQINIGGIEHGDLITSTAPGFKGRMQQFIINAKNIFELIKSGQISNHKMNAILSKDDNQIDSQHNSVSFTVQNTYIGLPQMKAYNSINIRFRFRTFEQNGLIMYNAGKASDFIAIELIKGRLHYTLNLGYGSLRIKDNVQGSLSDNEWHKVVIGRPSRYRHTLMVDGHIASSSTRGDNYHLDLDGILFLGGVRQNMYTQLPRILLSKSGFQGCFGGLETNGELIDAIKDALVPSALVEEGCEDAVSYHWGTGNIVYEYPSDKRPDTNKDTLSLGIITPSFDAILARIDSYRDSSKPGDFMQLEINGGKVYMNYNLGSKDINIGDISTKINDGNYHVIRFTRNGANSTLQVDDKPIIQKYPQGNKHLTVFNDQNTISVGGRLIPSSNKVERSFMGVITGVVYNGLRPLELAAVGDARIRGNVKKLETIPFDYRDRNPDLFSKEAIRKMIDKVYKSPEKERVDGSNPRGNGETVKTSGLNGYYNCDDEEDCQPGSGSGDSSWVDLENEDSHKETISNSNKEDIRGSSPRGSDTTLHVPMSTYVPSPNYDEDEYPIHSDNDDFVNLIHPNITEDSYGTTMSTNYAQPTLFAIPGQRLNENDDEGGEGEGGPSDLDSENLGYEGYDQKWNLDETEPPSSEGADPPPIPTKTLPATMVLVIGIILGAFVAMILIVIIVLKMRTRVESAVKCETAEAAPRYQFAPPNDYGELGEGETATTSLIDGENGLFNSCAVNGDRSRLFRKSNGSKPVREWYV